MKKALALGAVVLTLGLTVALDADAKRLGGGRSAGLQRPNVTAPAAPAATRNLPPTQGQAATPGQAAPVAGAAAAAPGAAAAAAAPRSRWMAPLAGLAAGLGIAALASHFGFGEVLANLLTAGLVVMAVLFVIGLVLRKRAQAQGPVLAGAGAGGGQRPAPFAAREAAGGTLIGTGVGAGAAAATPAGAIPAGFDVEAFERNAKEQFMALQSANDAGDLARLRDYLTPEMFEVVRQELDARGSAPQRTEVFGLQAQVLEVAEEEGRYVVSVRFAGSVRDQSGAVPEDLDETWHLVKPARGAGGWVVAGIQQTDRAAAGVDAS